MVLITAARTAYFVKYQAATGQWYSDGSAHLPLGMAKAFMSFVKGLLTSVADDQKASVLAKTTDVLAKVTNAPNLNGTMCDTYTSAFTDMLSDLLWEWRSLGLDIADVFRSYSGLLVSQQYFDFVALGAKCFDNKLCPGATVAVFTANKDTATTTDATTSATTATTTATTASDACK